MPEAVSIYYSKEYALATGLETVTKSAEVAAAIAADPALAVRLVAPAPATRAELRVIHDDAYLATVFASGPGELATGPRTPALRRSLLASTGGMRDAAREWARKYDADRVQADHWEPAMKVLADEALSRRAVAA